MAKKEKLFNQTVEFKALSKEWEKKLAEAKFDDISPIEHETILSPQIFGGQIGVENKKEYQDFCLSLLQRYLFPEYNLIRVSGGWIPRDRIVFELHTRGKVDKDIVDILKSEYGVKIGRSTVNRIIWQVKEAFQKQR